MNSPTQRASKPLTTSRPGSAQSSSKSSKPSRDPSRLNTDSGGNINADVQNARGDSRPLSFAPSHHEKMLERRPSRFTSTANNGPTPAPQSELQISKSPSLHEVRPTANTPQSPGRRRQPSQGSINEPISPSSISRSPTADTASHAFPLTNIDYESSPAAVAQELSNLQAIRRMSMNVDAADPDLPSFGGGFSMPTVAPSASADQDDTAHLFWVPAHLHPELAPKEFKTFVEDRVDTIRRRSGSESGSAGSLERGNSTSSLDRRKSMLSKTVDVPSDLKDGADVLERKRSDHKRNSSMETSLQELESLVSDPSNLVRKMSLDRARTSLDSASEGSMQEDIPILPGAPTGGPTLKRSTRTQYRRGSLRKERAGLSRRGTARASEGEYREIPEEREPSPAQSTPSSIQEDFHKPRPLARVQTEPISPRAGRESEAPRLDVSSFESDDLAQRDPHLEHRHSVPNLEPSRENEGSHEYQRNFQSRFASNGRTTAAVPGYAQGAPVSQGYDQQAGPGRHSLPAPPIPRIHPERKSSHEFSRTSSQSSGLSGRPQAQHSRSKQPAQTLDDMANHPSMMPGTSTSTDALSFIPTLTEDRREEPKSKSSRDSGDSGSRKGSWGWLLGSEDKEKKEKHKEREREDKEQAKRSKARTSKTAEKSYDSTRLDVLRTASEGPRGRESLVLDRDKIRLDEERKKESNRKSGGDRKEKEPGLFSSLFGGGKKKADRDSGSKKPIVVRGQSPSPPRQALRADIDYNWTRFSILEERAIYRMAHIKLANPRRALHSQVLLSNFMYSYLAKVQQMHPQIQIAGMGQKGNQQRSQDQQKESDEFAQWQRYQEQQDRLAAEDPKQSDMDEDQGGMSSADFIDDYDPQHQQAEDQRNAYGQYSMNGNLSYRDMLGGSEQQRRWEQQQHQQQQQQQARYAQEGQFDDDRPPDDSDMW